MKRIFALLLALLLLAALTGCWPLEEQYTEKPVIYLYPEAETDVTVRLDYAGDLTCTYPAYDGAWRVAAAPDGTLTDERGQTYRYLYWEGTDNVQYDFSEGFCLRFRNCRVLGGRARAARPDPRGGQRVHHLLAPADGTKRL